MNYFLDTSYLVALFLPMDPLHAKAWEIATEYNQGNDLFLTTNIFRETLTIASQRGGKTGLKEYYQKLLIETKMLLIDDLVWIETLDIFFKEKTQKDISVIDCESAVLCKKHKLDAIITFDSRHFKKLGIKTLP